MKHTTLFGLVGLLSVLGSSVRAAPLGTAFNYQGQLTDGANPASGMYDFRCAIFEVAGGGHPVAGPLTNRAVGVSNGLFTTTLDFGSGVFAGDGRWLEIAVRTNGSADAFVVLGPRQLLMPAPYALYASKAGAAVTASNAAPGSIDTAALAIDAVDSSRITDRSITADDLSSPVLHTLFWQLDGNSGTTPGRHFLGTKDEQALEFKVNGLRAGRLEFGGDASEDRNALMDGAPNVILGAPINFVAAGAVGAAVGGGGATNYDGSAHSNSILASFAVIGGGLGNRIATSAGWSTIAGGYVNTVATNSGYSVIGGGRDNIVSYNAENATIAGGSHNDVGANSQQGTIGGGYNNNIAANSWSATVAGGFNNDINADSAYSAVGGGRDNNIAANSEAATISGGDDNDIGANCAHGAIGGGRDNNIAASSEAATVAGGFLNAIGTNASYSAIGGGTNNSVAANAEAATIAGGCRNEIGTNCAHSAIGGGYDNSIAAYSEYATIAGGEFNLIGTNAPWSTIGGGEVNVIKADSGFSTIAGGLSNQIGTNADHSVVGGGRDNSIAINASYATIPGGYLNSATNYGFAAGRRAKANHTGAFVWGDSFNANIASTNANSVTMRASGGYRLFSNGGATAGAYLAPGSGSWTSLSDRNAKENLAPVNAGAVLEKVAALPLSTWNYTSQNRSVRHLGPMAQDFHAAFDLGESDTGITTIDADGVALAAIQGLNRKLEQAVREKEARIAELENDLAELRALVQTVAAKMNGGGR